MCLCMRFIYQEKRCGKIIDVDKMFKITCPYCGSYKYIPNEYLKGTSRGICPDCGNFFIINDGEAKIEEKAKRKNTNFEMLCKLTPYEFAKEFTAEQYDGKYSFGCIVRHPCDPSVDCRECFFDWLNEESDTYETNYESTVKEETS